MSALNIRNQCLFLAIYSLCILLFACIMSSGRPGQADPVGTSESVRFVCTSCERRNLPAFFSSLRACRIHQGMSKRCHGSAYEKVTVLTRPDDVIAGGSGGMGPCPPPQHQPPGIRQSYSKYIPVISLSYPCHIHQKGIRQSYSKFIPVISLSYPCHTHSKGICMVYTRYIPCIYLV